MGNPTAYKQQKNLSSVQLLAEAPTFIETLLSAIFSGALLLYVDLLDSLSYIVRYAMIMLLSGKLTQDLRYEYNYGIGKIEAVSSILCDGIMLFGMFLTLCFSVYSIYSPSKPSDLLITVAALKLYDIVWDIAFFVKQRKIFKAHRSAISEANYASAFGALLFDAVTCIALLAMWLFRNNPIGGYISPVVSIFVAIYLAIGCVKRIRIALSDLTDKALPEEQQLKMLKVLTRHHNSYSQFHSIDSRKTGDVARIDVNLSFENDARVEEVLRLKEQMQKDFDEQIGDCVVNIIVQNE